VKFATKTGDKGDSGLYNGKRVSKASAVFGCLGDLDELNSVLGWSKFAIEGAERGGVDLLFERLQADIYRLMSIVGFEGNLPAGVNEISDEDVTFVEARLMEYEGRLGDMKKFVKPGTTEAASRLHIVRTVCRRAERSLVGFADEVGLPENVIKYVNRLSDLFFAMACCYEEELKEQG